MSTFDDEHVWYIVVENFMFGMTRRVFVEVPTNWVGTKPWYAIKIQENNVCNFFEVDT